MGPTSLVSREQIQGGEDLLLELPLNRITVTSAAWAKAEGDGQPYLYIVSPTTVVAGPLEAAGRLVTALRKLDTKWTDPFRRLDPFAIKLIGPSDRLAREMQAVYEQFSDDQPTLYYGSHLAPSLLEPAYFYPAKLFTAPAAPSA